MKRTRMVNNTEWCYLSTLNDNRYLTLCRQVDNPPEFSNENIQEMIVKVEKTKQDFLKSIDETLNMLHTAAQQ